ncbi:MAG: SMC-Scp complex subunit ScpB, partial [Polyangiaceae bacterium]|nr:SMC-Scp complex subunit ScpB [Polyangiaceae bacterium]
VEPAVETATEELAEEHPVTSVPPPPESSEQISAATAPAPKGKRGKKAPAAPKPAKTGAKGKRGKGKDETAAPPESSKKLLGETEAEEAEANEDTWHGSDPEATVNLRGELADLFPLRDDDIVLTETDEAEEPTPDDGTPSDGEGEDGEDDDGSLDVGSDEAAAPESAEATVADPTTTARDHLRGLIEALVFASDKPLSVRELSRASEAPSKDVKVLLEELRVFYKPRGIQLDEVAGGFVFRTNAVFAPFVRDLTKQKPVKLTRAQLETLAILAYRQPITRPEIDDIRGVDSGPVLKMLLERDLVRILGKKDEPGRPLLYGSTPEFLEFFGLKSLKDLPTLQEFTELNEDSKRVAEKELGESFDDIQTLLDHGEEDAAPEASGTGEAHDTEIPPAFADPEAADDWDGAPTLDAAEGETAADTDAPSAPTDNAELEEEPEPPTQDQDALTAEQEELDEDPVASADEDAVASVSEEDPNLDEADASEATETPSKTPTTTEESPDEEDDYDDDDFEDDDDDDDDDEDEEDDDE